MDKINHLTTCLLMMSMIGTAMGATNPNDYYNNIDKFKSHKESSFATDNINKQDIWGKYKGKVTQAQNAPQKAYYNDEAGMNNAAQTAKSTSETYKAAMHVWRKEPDINIVKNSGYVQSNQLYVSDAYNLAHGISDTHIDCTGGTVCHYEYEPKSCIKTVQQTLQCTKYPVVKTHTDTYYVDEQYSGNMTNTGRNSNSVVLPQGGEITAFTFKSRSKQGYRGLSTYQFYLNGVLIGTMPISGFGWMSWINISASNLSVPVPQTGAVKLSFVGYSDDSRYEAPYTLTENVKKTKKVADVKWVTQCSTI